jgi:hypothetical protein
MSDGFVFAPGSARESPDSSLLPLLTAAVATAYTASEITNRKHGPAASHMDWMLLYTAACVVLPILWGVAVNFLFNLWRDRTAQGSENDRIFPDYQI